MKRVAALQQRSASFARSRRCRAARTPPCRRPATTTSSTSRWRGCSWTTCRRSRSTGRSTVRSWRRWRSPSAPTMSTRCRRPTTTGTGPRRAPLEEIRRNIQAAGQEPVERDGRFDRRRQVAPTWPRRSPRRRRVSERPSACLRSRAAAAVRCPLRRPLEVCRPAARRRDRRRPDPVDRVSARASRGAEPTASCRASRSPRAGRSRRWRSTRRSRSATSARSRWTRSSRTSVALVRVLCAREFRIRPMLVLERPAISTRCSRTAMRRC